MLTFGLYPNVYATGALKGLRQMLEMVWVRDHTPGNGVVYIVSAFANYNGGARFYKTFAEHVEAGGSLLVLLGGSTSQRLASRQVVEALLECGARVIAVNRKRLMHAKMYGVEDDQGGRLIVSSGNFTGPGMAQNVEASVLIAGRAFADLGFSWSELFDSVQEQNWQLFEPRLDAPDHPAWQLFYDESPGEVKLDESDEVTLVVRLGHADTGRIQADRGTNAGRGSQYFWLSKDCFDFFPPLTIRNQRGYKGTLSTKIQLGYVDLNETREERVTFEAENNLDFRLGTGRLRYTKLAKEGDLACVTRVGEAEYQLRIVAQASDQFDVVDGFALTHIGHQGKRYGFVDNDQFAAAMGTSTRELYKAI